MKAVLRGKFIALSAFIKKLERSYISNLKVHLKSLGKKKANTTKRNREWEIFKLLTEINKLETLSSQPLVSCTYFEMSPVRY
jgi:hypothetical protein